ncbi:DUF2818 family protein [Neisseria perflava]|uniref:DUF2818 family protein n=1 Tax=Neisseria perflava TaxID=33053 RepID=UPI0020A086AD|nr:DUF2818 family protein [Neisseria perflava]MCP1661190.1 hypothetical protein [Neisseria perflava]MCP1773368.1 hypothetical protein [Neisseria perflava]
MTAPMYILLLLALIFANAPFLTQKLFGVMTVKRKHFGHHLLELAVGYTLTAALAYLIESRAGAVQLQGWEFYAVTVCLYLIFAFPCFVWRYFWHSRNQQ